MKRTKDYNMLTAGLARFHQCFPKNGIVYLEDSILWYCLDMGIEWYLGLNINERISFKQSYFNMVCLQKPNSLST